MSDEIVVGSTVRLTALKSLGAKHGLELGKTYVVDGIWYGTYATRYGLMFEGQYAGACTGADGLVKV